MNDNIDKWAAAMTGVLLGAGLLATIGGLGLLIAFPVMWTWNAVMPYLFGWPVLTWGKAWCLYFLCATLFGLGNAKSSR